MGLSGSKTTTTTGPSAAALPNLQAGTNALTNAYNATSSNANSIGSSLFDAFNSFNASRQNNPLTTGATSYVSDVLGGKYLSGNPELQNVINTTNGSVTDQVNAIFARAGHSGSSRQYGELGKRLAENESALRYQNYSDEQDRIGQAITQALALRSADNTDIGTLLSLGAGATQIPLAPAQTYAGGLGSLWGNSQTQTTNNSGNILGSLLNAGASIGSAAIMASDRRLKTDIVRIGTEPDGLGIYQYRYAPAPTDAVAALMPGTEGGDQIFTGVMADEVAKLRPWALGPVVDGYLTVDYSKLEAA